MASESEKNFCLEDYDAYGFDFDGCLIKYKWEPFFKLIHVYIYDRLVSVRGYSAAHIKPYEQGWKDVMFRGVIVDTQRGNLLKVMANGTITRAYHGARKMTVSEMSATYPDCRLPVWEEFLKDFNHHNEFHVIDNTFEGPLLMIFVDLITHFDEKHFQAESYQQLWDEVFNSYVQFFSIEKAECPLRFIDICKDPKAYCLEASTDLKRWLKQLKTKNKIVFLMTSSYMHFAAPMLKFLLGPDAEDYFDFFLGQAGKPLFFHRDERHQYIALDDSENPVTEFQAKKWYHKGSLVNLNKFLSQFSEIPNPKILYVGDGLKNDVVPSKQFADWGTLLILEAQEAIADLTESFCDRDKQNGCTRHLQMIDKAEHKYLANSSVWGSFFTEGGEETLSARATRENADLVVPWLDYITGFHINHKFSTFDARTKREGYFPPCRATKCPESK